MQFNKALSHTVVWKVLNTVINFIINLMLVRMLGVKDSGSFFYILAILSFLVLVLSISLESGILFFSSTKAGSIFIIGKFILLTLLLQFLIAYFILYFIDAHFNRILLATYVVASIAVSYISALYAAQKSFFILNFTLFFVNLIGLVFIAMNFYHYNNNIADNVQHDSVVIFLLLPFFQAAILFVFFIFKRKRDQQPVDKFSVTELLRYTGVVFLGNVLFFLVTRIDYFFVEKYCTPAALSNYIQISKLGQLLVLLPSMIATVIFPYTSSSGSDFTLNKLQQLCRWVNLLFAISALGIIVLGRWGFPWLFGQGFDQMYNAMLCYLPGFWALSLLALLAAYLAGKAMNNFTLIASAIALVVVLIGDILLIPAFGINAAAAASSAAYLACLAYLLYIYKSKLSIGSSTFFINK